MDYTRTMDADCSRAASVDLTADIGKMLASLAPLKPAILEVMLLNGRHSWGVTVVSGRRGRDEPHFNGLGARIPESSRSQLVPLRTIEIHHWAHVSLRLIGRKNACARVPGARCFSRA